MCQNQPIKQILTLLNNQINRERMLARELCRCQWGFGTFWGFILGVGVFTTEQSLDVCTFILRFQQETDNNQSIKIYVLGFNLSLNLIQMRI